jgi:RNA methyltransferase, TrmH family
LFLMSAHIESTGTVITSPGNPRVKWLVSLRKRRTRDAEGVTIVEGYDELRLALEAGVRPQSLFHCPELADGREWGQVVEEVAAQGAEVFALGRTVFTKISVRESPDGWLAVVPTPGVRLDAVRLRDNALVLVCEAVEKPGNLGAMVRTADAAGLDAVLAASPVADWGNPNVVRASKGAIFAVQVAAASSAEVADWLRRRGVRIVAASPQSDTTFSELDLTSSTAVVVGAEHEGLDEFWVNEADAVAAIPMVGRVNSLNVATAAAIILYEAVRQRVG